MGISICLINVAPGKHPQHCAPPAAARGIARCAQRARGTGKCVHSPPAGKIKILVLYTWLYTAVVLLSYSVYKELPYT
jgi:hypothetical protein